MSSSPCCTSSAWTMCASSATAAANSTSPHRPGARPSRPEDKRMKAGTSLAVLLAATCVGGVRASSRAADASRYTGAAAVADAAMAGDKEAVRALLKQGLDVNGAQGDGLTALHWAAQRGDADLASV